MQQAGLVQHDLCYQQKTTLKGKGLVEEKEMLDRPRSETTRAVFPKCA